MNHRELQHAGEEAHTSSAFTAVRKPRATSRELAGLMPQENNAAVQIGDVVAAPFPGYAGLYRGVVSDPTSTAALDRMKKKGVSAEDGKLCIMFDDGDVSFVARNMMKIKQSTTQHMKVGEGFSPPTDTPSDKNKKRKRGPDMS